MDLDSRYEFLEKIGSGSFATVYRARDLELGREVAIKQIHQQYLDDKEQLERYWQEAQLLASLHHPNIVTIFDIHRERGWLILELMQTNLSERMEGRQMDLRALRTAIAHSLRALKYLHERGIVHGDIKPSNMMIDARRRVKLGDFGLARRVSDEDGSLLKGTTKYMAPESVSDEFGDVGPASDLYSLGFSAYELMCGPNFESLFPGLSSFGRNKQVAWMMWHAAPDRRLPEIDRVLQGVPDDLSHVIQKLCEKDQSKRYQSAEDALSDLKIDLKVVNKGEPAEPEQGQEPKIDPERKKRLLLAGTAVLASLIVCLFLLFYQPATQPTQKVNRFEITRVDVSDRVLRVVSLDDLRRPDKITIPKNVRISLEHFGDPEGVLLEDLKPGDRIEIEFVPEGDSSVMKITAARPYASRGRVVELNTQESVITVALDEDQSHENLTLRTPKSLKVLLNVNPERFQKITDKRVRANLVKQKGISLNSVRKGDLVIVSHLPEPGGKSGRLATGYLFVRRPVEASGRVVNIDVKTRDLIVELGTKERPDLPIAEDCKITLEEKGTRHQNQSVDVIRIGDIVDVRYDTLYREIHITRGAKRFEGAVTAVDDRNSKLIISLSREARQEIFRVDDNTKIRLGNESARLEELRVADSVVVLSLDTGNGEKTATAITASRPTRSARRALLIGVRSFDDKTLQEIPYSKANTELLAKTFEQRYAIKRDERMSILDDPTRKTMQDEITKILNQSGDSTQVVIYISTHAFVSQGKVYLAGRKAVSQQIAETGLPLDWVLDQMEKCKARYKTLLLDISHTWRDINRPDQPSTAEMVKLSGIPLKTVAVIASCSGKERGVFARNQIHGAFAAAVARSFAGRADVNRDLTITPEELFADLGTHFAKTDFGSGKTMTPQKFPMQ
ncbi:MAG: hypothetical protein Tsb009_29620 [Planctomycetaceae bacterium]